MDEPDPPAERAVITDPAEAAAAVGTWDTLARVMSGCAVCDELAATRTQVVPGVRPRVTGPRPLMLVGEAPGAQEDEQGLPFVGRSGALLDQLLLEAGTAREDVVVANVLKCRPPQNRPPRRSEVLACRPWLTRQLMLVDPAVVVAMGSTAVTWFLGAGARIGALRGEPIARDGYLLMATYHPSAALRFGPRGKPIAALRDDLTRAVALVRDGGPRGDGALR